MKKTWLYLLIILVVIMAMAIMFYFYKTTVKKNIGGGNQEIKNIVSVISDVRSNTYIVDNQLVSLRDGISARNPESQIITRYFGNEASGDLDGDGIPDSAFILTQDGGGSGTFFFMSAALSKDGSYSGLNAILLGDRIAPQSTEIKDGLITVNYADRKADEPFSTPSSIGISRYFKVEDMKLVEVSSTAGVIEKK